MRVSGALAVAGLVATSDPSLAQPRLLVTWEGERLTVEADDVPVRQLVEEIARRIGMHVSGAERLDARISIRSSDTLPQTTLRTVLTGASYVLIGDDEGGAPPRLSLRILGSAGVRAHGTQPVVPSELVSRKSEPNQLDELEQVLRADGPTSADVLWRFLLSDDPDVRTVALDSLVALDPREGLLAIQSVARSPDASARMSALEVLARQSDGVVLPAMIEFLSDPDIGVKGAALQVLLAGGDGGLDPVMEHVQRDPDPIFRRFAFQALARAGGLGATRVVEAALRDPDEAIRQEVEAQLRLGQAPWQ